MNKRELQRLAEDPEIMEAVETLALWGVNGAMYDRLIEQAAVSKPNNSD